MIAATLLGVLYGLNGGAAVRLVKALHSARKIGGEVDCPSTLDQKLIVFTILDKIVKKYPPPVPKLRKKKEHNVKKNIIHQQKQIEKPIPEEIPKKETEEQQTDESRHLIIPQIDKELLVHRLKTSDMSGPWDKSNWIIKDVILCGCYPMELGFSNVTPRGENPLKLILDAGTVIQ